MKRVHLLSKLLLVCMGLVFVYGCSKDNDLPTEFNYSSFTDSRDGKTYKTIKIGNQEWMAENLAYKTTTGCWIYGDKEDNYAKFGRLYTWEAALEAVPAGWHIPSDNEWKEIEIVLGMSQGDADRTDFRGSNEGKRLKAIKGWSEDGNGTDDFGFSALPGGFRSNSGSFLVGDWYGYFWSSTERDVASAWFRLLSYNHTKICRNFSFKEDAYSVRCVKD